MKAVSVIYFHAFARASKEASISILLSVHSFISPSHTDKGNDVRVCLSVCAEIKKIIFLVTTPVKMIFKLITEGRKQSTRTYIKKVSLIKAEPAGEVRHTEANSCCGQRTF